MHDVFTNLLVSCPNNGGLFLLHEGATYKLDSLDTTGLAVRGASMLRALQPARLVRFEGVNQDAVTSEADFDDIHDVLLDDKFRYVVKTDSNEIVKLDQQGREQKRWSFPGEPDSWHLNCLAVWNGKLVFSAFGDLRSHKEYKSVSRELGFVQDLSTGDKLITGLSQPHSLLAIGEKLLLANSEIFEIREYDRHGGLLRSKVLDGYTRGVLSRDGILFVGLSRSRNVDAGQLAHAVVVALDAESWEEIGRRSLPVDEIYSIQHVDAAAMIGTIARLASHSTSLLGKRAEKAHLEVVARNEHIRDLDAQLRDQEYAIRENERKIFGLLETVHGKDLHIQSREEVIRHKDLEIQRRDEIIYKKEMDIQDRDEMIQDAKAELRARADSIQELEQQLTSSRNEAATRDHIFAEVESRLVSQREEIRTLGEELKSKDEVIADRDDVLQRSESRIATLTEEVRLQAEMLERLRGEAEVRAQRINDMSREADAAYSKLQTLTHQLEVSRARVVDMESSRSWRITGPLRAIKVALSVRKFGKRDRVKSGRQGSRTSDGQKGRNDVCDALRASTNDEKTSGPTVSISLDSARSPIVPQFDLRGSKLPIVILTTAHCTYVAEEIAAALRQIGVESRIIHKMPEAGYDDVPHFVICPQMFEQLPGFYVVFQMEQSVSSRWFTPDYLARLENSFAIFDYSLANIEKLENMGLSARQMYHVPIGYLENFGNARETDPLDYDVIFYGDIQNARRREFIAELSKVCKVEVINDLFGAPLQAELARARLVVNIHYYAGALLETTRLWECLSLGKLVVSERSSDMDQHHDLVNLVDFVDVDDVAGMVERVSYWLSNDALRQQRLQRNKNALRSMPNRFDTYFYRFLLATDNITFDEFWNLAGRKMELGGDKVCLNLPEYVRRSRSFDRDNRFGFVRFAGLRHCEGWVGCAMSYKLMIMLARQQGLQSVAICEDDVEFPQGFECRWAAVQKELTIDPSAWDIFSGLLADLHSDTNVLSAYDRDGIQFAITDRLISTVFNVYNASVFDAIASWDERHRDATINTIDRYLEQTRSLRIVTTLPFLVGHKEELHSTLWGFQNTQYVDLIAASSELLANKIRERLGKANRLSTVQ